MQDDGLTLRDHLNSLWRQSGRKPRQLEEATPLPELAAHVWEYFSDLHNERPNNGFAPGALTSTQILDWCTLTGTELERWEIKAIRMLDKVWRAAHISKDKE